MRNINSILNEVASKADTEDASINAAETRRVIACLYSVLETKPHSEVARFHARMIEIAEDKRLKDDAEPSSCSRSSRARGPRKSLMR